VKEISGRRYTGQAGSSETHLCPPDLRPDPVRGRIEIERTFGDLYPSQLHGGGQGPTGHFNDGIHRPLAPTVDITEGVRGFLIGPRGSYFKAGAHEGP
jgi:hypothetical protein